MEMTKATITGNGITVVDGVTYYKHTLHAVILTDVEPPYSNESVEVLMGRSFIMDSLDTLQRYVAPQNIKGADANNQTIGVSYLNPDNLEKIEC